MKRRATGDRSLYNRVCKIFVAVMAKILTSWAMIENKISPSQKCFLPMEGCMEHSFVLESVMSDGRWRRKDMRVLGLDLKNAFDSVSHELMWLMMKRLGLPVDFVELCKEIYCGRTLQVHCSSGYTREIPINIVIKQGCSLSPFYFNLALEALLPSLK